MAKENEPVLSDIVRVSRHYQRSIRIDADLGRSDALDGYICHATAQAVLESLSRQLLQSNQRAFIWTGPFGGGKSSLAVALASALGTNRVLRAKAREALRLASLSSFDEAFPCRRGWLTIPIVGKRTSVVAELSKALHKARGGRGEPKKWTPGALIDEICHAAESKEHDGVLVLIDEMGKFLEASALGLGDDINFFQDLAEIAARAKGRLVVVGILHQAFAEYARRLGIDTRDDWAKVQGRYSDIPLVSASDEVVELIGRAIEVDNLPRWTASAAQSIATSIRSRRTAVGPDFAASLTRCWPLHPAMAALLGPISKRQFGQNERSTFGFLASVEPFGFRSYLKSTPITKPRWYRPDDYWDYLRSNLEPAILSSPDGHRWAQAVEAVQRTEAKASDPLHVALIKNIAIIDLFRNGSGLAAESNVLAAILNDESKKKVEGALEQLAALRVIIFKKHIGAWSVFEGSDFDIEAAIAQARAALPSIDFELLSSLTSLHPIVAKRHYHNTGTMRWMNMALCRLDDVARLADTFRPNNGEFGLFLLALPARQTSEKVALRQCADQARLKPWCVAIGVPRNHAKIEDLGAELVSLQHVQSRHELSGDSVARREVQARLSDVRAHLQEQLRAAVANAQWVARGQPISTGTKLSRIASDLADVLFDQAPKVWSELVNRDSPSSNSVKARRDLMHRMINNERAEKLGIEGFPAERGLYETLLSSTGLHGRGADGVWKCKAPDAERSSSFLALWRDTKAMFADTSIRVKMSDIHAMWAAPPYGVRAGIAPVFMTAFLLSNKGNVAIYKDGLFVPQLTDVDIDEYLQDALRFSLRWIVIDTQKASILAGIAKILSEVSDASGAMDPLEAARGLVALVFGLPAWSRRTHRLSSTARNVRDTLLKASDPHKVLFVDLPAILDEKCGTAYIDELRAPIVELVGAYDELLRSIESSMFEALDAPPDQLEQLRARAEALEGVSGDLRQDAFAARLAKHDASRQSIEGILSLAANKPPRDWSDRDIDVAKLEITQAALRFRRDEAFVSVKGRKPKSEAFAVVIGAGASTKTLTRSFAVPDRHAETVEAISNKLLSNLKAEGVGTDLLLAALAKVGMRLTAEEESSERGTHD